jgi:glucokinase
MLLAGDIGGTKTILALYTPEKGPYYPIAEKRYPSAIHHSLEAIIQDYLEHTQETITTASFGVAGPVISGKANVTNLSWKIEAAKLQKNFDWHATYLLNDLEAIAYAIPYLDKKDLFILSDGEAIPGGSIAVIAPGTGLGEAYLTWDGIRYRAHGSEGGHVDFAPTNQIQLSLLEYLHNELHYEHVSYEQVCSGLGIWNIYRFLKHAGMLQEPVWFTEEIAKQKDPVPLIANTALNPNVECEICQKTLELFVSILGAETGNMGLNLLATGGIYLGGGIPPRILPALQSDHFSQAFYNKGRLSTVLKNIPINVITYPNSALMGAACFGLHPYDW